MGSPLPHRAPLGILITAVAVGVTVLAWLPGAPLTTLAAFGFGGALIAAVAVAAELAWSSRAAPRPLAAEFLSAADFTQGRADELAPEFADHFLGTEFAAAQRGRRVTVALFGFDDVEEFAEAHGRAAANAAVRRFSAVLKLLTRKMNVSARYGWRADTFLSVLSDADAEGAVAFVNRVLIAFQPAAGDPPAPRVSVGIAEHAADMEAPARLLEQAEQALAEARLRGGGGICVRAASRPGPVQDQRLRSTA